MLLFNSLVTLGLNIVQHYYNLCLILFPASLQCSVNTVSYTHLDVYKRQVLGRSIKTLIDTLILSKGIS